VLARRPGGGHPGGLEPEPNGLLGVGEQRTGEAGIGFGFACHDSPWQATQRMTKATNPSVPESAARALLAPHDAEPHLGWQMPTASWHPALPADKILGGWSR
jgi:hypothetical protein